MNSCQIQFFIHRKEEFTMVKFKNYAKRFLRDEDGAELIEWAIVVAIAAILVTAAIAIMNTMQGSLNSTDQMLQDNLVSGLTNANGGGGNGGGEAGGAEG
jgi:Flp pilus assembly pilin Flp